MTLDQAAHELRQATPFRVDGSPHERLRLSMEAAKVLRKVTHDHYLGQRIDDAAEWSEDTVRIYTEDRARLLMALTVAA